MMTDDPICKHFKKNGGTPLFSATKGVCYSLNLREYFPNDLIESLKAENRTSIEKVFMEDDGNCLPKAQQFHPGPLQGLQLILNIEGKNNTSIKLP